MKWPVSIKGVLFDDEGRVLLGLNDRDEWELIGGRLEENEQPESALVREFREETGLDVSAEHLLTAYVFEPVRDHQVLIVVYGCRRHDGELRTSDEHRLLAFHELPLPASLVLPNGYRDAIELWH